MADKFHNWQVHTPNTDGSISAPPRKPNQPSDEEINARLPDDHPLKPNEVDIYGITRAGSVPSGLGGGVGGVDLKPNQVPAESIRRHGGINMYALGNIDTSHAKTVGTPTEHKDEKAATHGNMDVDNAWPDKEKTVNRKPAAAPAKPVVPAPLPTKDPTVKPEAKHEEKHEEKPKN